MKRRLLYGSAISPTKNDVAHYPKKSHLLLLIFFTLFSFCVSAQQRVTGKVTSDKTPIVGATVTVKNSTVGTQTDGGGNFSIDAPANATLVISSIGFATQELKLGTNTNVAVELLSDSKEMEQVVVVGYGTQRRETLTGSISKIGGAELTKSQAVNVTSSLAGRLPGLVVNQRTGVPGGEDFNIVIRGASSFNGTPGVNSPLIVIDGVPRDAGILASLNSQDIESISVLKDASAAIYGARAANGVILITTKGGVRSKTVYNLSYAYGITNPTKVPDMMDAALFAEVFNENQFYAQGRPANGGTPFYSATAIQKFRDGSDPVLYPNTDWAEISLRDNTPQQRVNFQASGGSDKIRYMFSFGTVHQEGNYVNQPYDYKQYNARVRVDADLSKNLSVSANIAGALRRRSEANGTDFVTILQANPTLPAIYPNGLLAGGRFDNSPLLSNRRGYNKWDDDPLTSTFSASYKVPFIKGMVLDASYNYDLRNQFQKSFNEPHYWHTYNVITQNYDRVQANTPISLTDRYDKWVATLVNFRISYNTTIAQDHNIAVMAGAEQQRTSRTWTSAFRQNFLSGSLQQIDLGSTRPEDRNNGGNTELGAYNSFFGRLNYNYQSKYLLEFVMRADGSQKFAKGNRYGYFPGVSAGWRISQEKFMENVEFVNELKLRASYAELGNDRVNNNQFVELFAAGNNAVFGGNDAPGIFSTRLANPPITWEVGKKLDVGVNATLFNRLLDVEVTVFNQKRRRILMANTLAQSQVFGFPGLPDENKGAVDVNGFEVSLTHRKTSGKLSYSINGNIAYAKSKIIFMGEVPPKEAYQKNTGFQIGSGLYYKADGIFNTKAELDGYPHGTGAQVGDIKVLDLNKDGVINGDDRYRSNNSPTPLYVFGLTGNVGYKGFDLTLFFQGQTKAFSYDGTVGNEFGLSDLDNAPVFRAKNRWTINNQEGATMPRANDWQPGNTDFFLYDATFIRLKNFELGYTLNNNLIKKAGISNLRAFVNATNAFTWSKEIKWRDPELSGNFTTYPPLKILTFGINLQF
jgi:TonB-linked SusC/RagA family outer membrane protein